MTDELPPLPEPHHESAANFDHPFEPFFTADQMRAYAVAAVAREREKIAAMIAPEHLAFSDEEWRLRCELADAIRGGD